MLEGDIKESLAPGCFGSGPIYESGSRECASCIFAPRCAPLAAATMAGFRARGIRSADDRRRERYARHARDFRKRKREARPAPATSGQPITQTPVDRDELLRRFTSLKGWVAGNGHRQRNLRGRERELVSAWAKLNVWRACAGRDPSLSEFAAALKVSKSAAQKRMAMLRALEGKGGPWEAVSGID
jgi:hypothetical protein